MFLLYGIIFYSISPPLLSSIEIETISEYPTEEDVNCTYACTFNAIVVDETMATTIPGIYAAGDLIAAPERITGTVIPSATWPDAEVCTTTPVPSNNYFVDISSVLDLQPDQFAQVTSYLFGSMPSIGGGPAVGWIELPVIVQDGNDLVQVAVLLAGGDLRLVNLEGFTVAVYVDVFGL